MISMKNDIAKTIDLENILRYFKDPEKSSSKRSVYKQFVCDCLTLYIKINL